MNWYKTNHNWINNFSNIKVGDQLFWLRDIDENGVKYYHTGKCISINPVVVVHSTKNNGKEGSIKSEKTKANGNMWNQPFVGAGRLKQ
jgi:hypothetical protein